MQARGIVLAVLLGGLWLGGCQPGLGHQVSAHDYAFAFMQRDDRTIRMLSTESLRAAVWDRLEGPEEFRRVAAKVGHGEHGEVVDSQFREREAVIQFRTESRAQYRLYLLYENEDWRVDDVVREKEPGVYVSMRRQIEAELAVRDFRRGLERLDLRALAAASSSAMTREVWAGMGGAKMEGVKELLGRVAAETEGELGEVFVPEHERLAAKTGGSPEAQYTFYFAKEQGHLVVDDVGVPGSKEPLRALLRGRDAT